jgi:hypothetical protein
METVFDREKHIYRSNAFEEIIKDTIRFFNGTPVHKLPPSVRFSGTGVYAIYYTGKSEYYKELYKANRIEFYQPIYAGKAVPRGWRQGKTAKAGSNSTELFSRLQEHRNSIDCAVNLDQNDFFCRFMILEDSASDLISTVEAALIKYYNPVWNTNIDGFGNHDPGSGRYNQAKSAWDILHPGRPWADKCIGSSSTKSKVEEKVVEYFTYHKNNNAE